MNKYILLAFVMLFTAANQHLYSQKAVKSKKQSSASASFKEFDRLSRIFLEKQSLDSAFIYGEKALAQVEKEFGKDTAYCSSVKLLMDINYYKGDYKQAIGYGQALKNNLEILKGKKHLDYISCIGNLGELNQRIGNYSAAEPLLLEAIETRKEILGTKNIEYAGSLGNLGGLYHTMGKYSDAEPLFREALNVTRELKGATHPDYAQCLNNLALLYYVTGKYRDSETLYIESLKIRKESLGISDPGYAEALSNLGELYRTMGNYNASEPLHLEAIKIRKGVLGPKHPDYCLSLMCLGALYYSVGNYTASEPLFISAANIQKDVLGPTHPRYVATLNNLAVLHEKKEDYSAAKILYEEILKIKKETFGEKHQDYAFFLCNLARLCKSIGDLKASEELYKEGLRILSETVGEKHPEYIKCLNSFGGFYSNTGNLSLAEPLLLKSIVLLERDILHNFSFLSEIEKELYFKKWSGNFSTFYSFSINRQKENASITSEVYNSLVTNKGLLLKSSTAMRTSILSSYDSSLINQYKQWISLKKEISKLSSTEISKRKKDPEVLEKQANDLEKELVKKSSALSDLNKLQNLTWLDVQKSLKKNEAAIEFLNFTEGKKNDTITYCALIITPESQFPEMIRLFEEKELKNILESYNGNNFNYVSGIYGDKTNPNSKLYELIWKPMEPYLKGIKNVYVSPSGLLHKVSFAALSKKKGNYLSDGYNLNMVSSTGKVALPENFVFDNSALTSIYGDVNYNTDSTKKEIWKYLEGTKTETEKISSTLKEKSLTVNYYSSAGASESEFKKSAVNSNVIHIATHGFFFPDPEQELEEMRKRNSEKKNENVVSTSSTTVSEIAFRGGSDGFGVWSFVKNKNPLMRSGLVLAGANDVWNIKYKTGNEEDGVLTAAEVATLDLRKTGLVVLSACETGLGDIKGSEGVYGLQRAFKMAGVKYIIMSLWQVPDKETSEFMTTFYDKLLKIKDIKKAFGETQKEMRKKYDPYFWAAFVLLE